MTGIYVKTKQMGPQSQDIVISREIDKHYTVIDSATPDLTGEINKTSGDFVVIGSNKFLYERPLDKINKPLIIGTGDVFNRLDGPEFFELVKLNKASGIITDCNCTIEPFKDYFGDMDIDIFYYKWGLDLDVLKNYNLEKTIDVFFSGKFSEYMFRRDLDMLFSNSIDIKYVRNRPYLVTNIPYDEYAKTINSSWFGIGGCLQRKEMLYYKDTFIGYTFPKTLEVAACFSCILNSTWGDREYLGFKDGENCVLFKTPRDAQRKVLYYLNDKELLLKVTRNGYELVHKNHNIKDTVFKLYSDLEQRYGKDTSI